MTTEAACRHCGQPIAPEARYCQSCGSDVSQAVGTTATDSVPQKTHQDLMLEHLKSETLGDYEILMELGRGGMATVYLAHDIALDRKVAIKVMSAALLDPGMAERFRREARTAAALNHPHIIPIYAVRDRYPLLFFAMKFIAGQSLDPILKTAGALPIPMVQAIVSQAGAALGYAHRRGVIHRDVKPANVMIDDEGWVVVTDFGIAKVPSATGLTVTGVTVGTPAYMSPEQCLGKEVTGASDQYSLGVVAYEMITGRPPFTADSAMALMFAQFQEPPQPILELRPDCPAPLAESVMRMLSKEPEQRWASMDDAVGAVGAAPLPHDDPTRKQLIAMAVSGENARLTMRLSTPTSPAPAVRRGATTTTPATPSASPAPASTVASAAPRTEPVVAKATRPIPAASTRTARGIPKLAWLGAVAAVVAVAGVALLRKGGEREGLQPAPASADSVATTTGDSSAPVAPVAVDQPPDSVPAPVSASVARVEVVAPKGSFQVGENRRLTAAARSGDGSAVRDQVIQWSSSAPNIATVSDNGTVRALRPGRAIITASADGKTTSVPIEVGAVPAAREAVAAVTVSPESAPLTVGGTLTLSAGLRDGAGRRLENRTVTWTSNSSAVTVSPAGQVLGVAPGTAVVTATSEGRSGSATISVGAVPVASLTLSQPPSQLKMGDSASLSISARDARGAVLPNRQVSWESSDPGVATVVAGLVVAHGPGTATVTATSEGRTVSTRITVGGPPPVDPAVEKARAVEQIGRGVSAFVAAINSRDMGRLRQAYPGMSAAEESDWSKLLNEKSLSKFEAALEESQPPKIDNNTAEVLFQVRMVLTYAGLPGETQRIKYQGLFRQENSTWRLMRLVQR